MLQAVIFDMDGTLIDSEPMWKQAEKEIFSGVGVDVCEVRSAHTASMTTKEVTEYWYQHFPWQGRSLAQVENDVVNRVAELIVETGQPMAGVNEILSFFQSKHFKIGLATNAPARLIPIVLNRLGITRYFHEVSSSEQEQQGKPHPAVYLTTAAKLNLPPTACIAFEDSCSGLVAAQDAKLKTVAVSDCPKFSDDKFQIADITIKQLSDFSDDHLKALTDITPR